MSAEIDRIVALPDFRKGKLVTDLSRKFPVVVDDEFELINSCVAPAGKRLLDVGCGSGEFTRRLATEGEARHIVGVDVDETALAKLRKDLPPNLEFRVGAAEALDFPDASFDSVLLFKSLHHVPADSMHQGLREIRRVLRPGGQAYVSEPAYEGDLNNVMKTYQDEGVVRAQAIRALEWALAEGLFRRERHIRFVSEVRYKDFEDFYARMMKKHGITDPQVVRATEAVYQPHQAANGAKFLRRMRVDVLIRQ